MHGILLDRLLSRWRFWRLPPKHPTSLRVLHPQWEAPVREAYRAIERSYNDEHPALQAWFRQVTKIIRLLRPRTADNA